MTASATTAVPPDIEPAERRLESVPRRADGVELLGDLPGSGYRQPPALARREDGQLVKLTPLLYQLVDAIDGNRGYDELARDLSRRIGKQASPNDVRFLVERKLMPLGLLRGADGSQPDVQRSNPLLVLKPRIVLSNPKWTGRLAAPFAVFFNPLVAAPIIAAFIGLTWWLLAEKGLASALHQAFYEPGLILVLWGLIVLSAAFHEVGHAAACRYGGGRPGVMGAGLYLAWPAFYTEVSDAYRLDRRGRLRVDLGGLYFNAIFSLAVAGAWTFTHDDALLLVIAVQLVQMVRQLAPFIRADGYHIVSDLTGVPDLFAHIKPTLLGLLPTRWGRPEHRTLKPWARAVVSIWVLTVVPLLLALLAYAVLILPRLAATAWDSMGIHAAETTEFWGRGDAAGVLLSGISTVLVAVPIVGIVYLLARIARRVAVTTWRGTEGRPGLRALAGLGTAALIALIIWAWWPGDQYRAIGRVGPAPAPTVLTPASSELPQQLLVAPQPTVATLPAPTLLIATVPVIDEVTPISELAATRLDRSSGPAPDGEPDDCWESWPFPFDPPETPTAGDNRAAACNTTDGTVLSDIAVSLLLATGDEPIDQSNEAHAYANCTACSTIAVAFQVILIVGYADEITPTNGAVAANFECERCDTEAFAYQLIVTLAEMPSDQVLRDIARILEEVEGLDVASMSEEEIYLALEKAKRDVLEALGDDLIVGLDGSSATSRTETSATTGDGIAENPGEEISGSNDGSTGTLTESNGATTETTIETTTTPEPTTDETTTTTETTTDTSTTDSDDGVPTDSPTDDGSTDDGSTEDTTTTESTDTTSDDAGTEQSTTDDTTTTPTPDD